MTSEEELYKIYGEVKLKDRGSIKWSISMIMPEHVSMLKQRHELGAWIDKPQLSEWKLEDMQQIVIKNF
ncbi:hypothetical protein [Rummeliibacillus pycnus]|uniref:hypothetical protein n=1 Tax=Rummeliibacillus pycnus TaxID=101070 RepID=UPI000C999E08|nr:hypothetical protein [Rummeliibacillus pycnus]